MAFRDTYYPARPIQPFWADFFALGSSNSEGHRGISKYFFLDHFSSSFLSQKCCQISVRFFCVLSGTRNQQCTWSAITFVNMWHHKFLEIQPRDPNRLKLLRISNFICASSNIKRNVYRNIPALNSRNLSYHFQTVEDSNVINSQLASIWKAQEARFQELELKIQGKVKQEWNIIYRS